MATRPLAADNDAVAFVTSQLAAQLVDVPDPATIAAAIDATFEWHRERNRDRWRRNHAARKARQGAA